MITYQQEDYSYVVPEIKLIVQDQWDELGEDQDEVKLDPRYDDYAAMEDNQQLLMVTARDGTQLIGYATYFTSPHLYHKAVITAHGDLIYVIPAYRNGRVGYRIIKTAEALLKGYGIGYVTVSFKTRFAFGHGIVRMGYDHIENVYGKFLGD